MSLPIIGITGYADRSARPPNISIFALSRTYVKAVALGGGAPMIIPPYLEEDQLRAIFERVDGLILSGGGDVHPASFREKAGELLWNVDVDRDQTEIALARWALAEGLPLLAICRGAQVVNVAAGGTLLRDIPTQIPDALQHSSVIGRPVNTIAHTVEVKPETRLAAIVGAGELGVNSAHHQAVKDVGHDLIVTASAPDGVPEATEAPGHPFCICVQWHPEVMVESHPLMRRLFEELVQVALLRGRP
jgi:putative glutamine amidotransferase